MSHRGDDRLRPLKGLNRKTKSNRTKSNKQLGLASTTAAKNRAKPSAVQKSLLNAAGNLQRAIDTGNVKGFQKQATKKTLVDLMEGYSMKDIKQLQTKQDLSPITIKALKNANLLSKKDEDSGLLSKGWDALKETGGWALHQLQRPQQAVMSGLSEWAIQGEKRGGSLTNVFSDLGQVGKAFLGGAAMTRRDTLGGTIARTAKIRRKQGRDDDLFGIIDPKHLTKGVGGFATNLIGAIASDPLTYLSFGATAVAKAGLKTATTLTRSTLKSSVGGSAAAIKLGGHLRGGGSRESFVKLLAADPTVGPAGAKAWADAMAKQFPVGMPNLKRGIRYNPLKVPGINLSKKLTARATGGTARINKAVAAGRISPDDAKFILDSGRKATVQGAISDIRSIPKTDVATPLGLPKWAERGVTKLGGKVPNVLKPGRLAAGTFDAFAHFRQVDRAGRTQMKHLKAGSEATAQVRGVEAVAIERGLTKIRKVYGDKVNDILTDARYSVAKDGKLRYSATVGGKGNLVTNLSKAEMEAVLVGRGFTIRNFDEKIGAHALTLSRQTDEINRSNYVPHVWANSLEAAPGGTIFSGIPDSIRLRKIKGSITEINARIKDGTLRVADGKGTKQLKDFAEWDPKVAARWQFETDFGTIIKKQSLTDQPFIQNAAMAKGMDDAGFLFRGKTGGKLPEGYEEIPAPLTRGGARDVTSMHTLLGVQPGETLAIHKALRKDMDVLAEVFSKTPNRLTKSYDHVLRLWKGYATVPFPLSTGFTLRNALGNYIANYMEGSITLGHYASAMRLERKALALGTKSRTIAGKVVGGDGNLALSRIIQGNRFGAVKTDWAKKLLDEFPILKTKGWTKTDIETLHYATNTGAVTKNFSYLEAGAERTSVAAPEGLPAGTGVDDVVVSRAARDEATELAEKAVNPNAIAKQYRKLSPKARLWFKKANPGSLKFKPIEMGTQFNSAVENNARLAHFIAKREQGLSVADSAASVRKYLFDYNDLSSVERRIFKRVSPFYTFTRKSIPLYAGMLLRDPGKFNRIGYVQQSLADQAKYQAEDVPEWMKESRGVPLPQSFSDMLAKIPVLNTSFRKGVPSVLNPDLPFKNLLNLIDAGGTSLDDPSGSENIRTLINLAGFGGPAGILPTAYQAATGKNIFSGGNIDDVTWIEAPLWARALPEGITFPQVRRRSVEGGKKVMTMKAKDVFILENMLPLLGKLRTLPGLTTSKKDLAAAGRRGLSMLTGLSAYPIDAQTRRTAYKSDTEKARRQTAENKAQRMYQPRSPYIKSTKNRPKLKIRSLR